MKIDEKEKEKRDIYIYFETPHIDKSIVETLQLNRLKGKFSTYSRVYFIWGIWLKVLLSNFE